MGENGKTAAIREALAKQVMNTWDWQLEKLERARELRIMELAPVVLPEDCKGDNNHIGWPVAATVGDTTVVIHRRIPGHNPWGAGQGDADSTFSLAVRSIDGGQTWSDSYDLRDAMGLGMRNRGGVIPLSHRYKFGPVNHSQEGYKLHLNGIGATHDGAVVALCNYGAFRSEDRGLTWTHYPRAFREDTTEGDIVYLGPRIIDHPDEGLLAFGNTVGYGRREGFPNPVDGPAEGHHHNLVILRSGDGGASWDRITHELPAWAAQHEPAALLHNGELFVIGREQIGGTDHVQMRLGDLAGPVDVKRTNMRNRRTIDTVDLDYNPLTGRFEVVRSKREDMRLDLWSIDPAAWDSAEWRFEGTLYSRQGEFYKTGDGFHPAGAVIDAEAGVQHIFIYMGHPNGPAGTFRMTRTLDTPRLAAFLTQK